VAYRGPSEQRGERKYMPPPWALVTVVLGGLAAFVWFNPLNVSSIADMIGALVGFACAGGCATLILWGIVRGAIAYFKNLRIALPLTAATALVGTIAWQVFDSLGPAGKFVMIAGIVVVAFLVGIVLQS
jgi:L-cysteine desulfidase